MEQKKRGRRLVTIILVLALVAGLCLLLYPTVSNWWNSKTQSRAIAGYDSQVAALSQEDYEAYFEAAREYNEALDRIGSASMLVHPDQLDGYDDLLDISGTGIMGYVTIDKINIELPIYHGTDSSVLTAGAGHLKGSSLPIGGESTHSVISAHRGLPSALLFTNLDKLEVGDTFTITVLDQVMTYQVDQISIVLPTEFENLYIEDGEDYCTLMTCTPYGINTHRLLVRGVRTNGDSPDRVAAEAYRINSLLVAPILAIPLLIIFFVWLIVRARLRRRHREANEEVMRDVVGEKNGSGDQNI
ncbi:MAG: class C sortase [Clostridiales bacterium]|nr:class C sortase [Clostridiales bacterium]